MACKDDALLIDLQNRTEINIDTLEDLDSYETVCTHGNKFFILSNKYKGRIGMYLLQVEYSNDESLPTAKFLISWPSKLDIADCDMYPMTSDGVMYLVVSFKSIGINTYNVFVFSL